MWNNLVPCVVSYNQKGFVTFPTKSLNMNVREKTNKQKQNSFFISFGFIFHKIIYCSAFFNCLLFLFSLNKHNVTDMTSFP